MYACPERGCSRKFKRPEHLSRHRLNHQPRKIHQCSVCSKDFVRLDLLQRHMQRHDRGMAYRSSGGYSTQGRPDHKRREVSAEDQPSGHPTPAPSAILRGQGGSSSGSQVEGPDTDTAADDVIENPEIVNSTTQPDILVSIQQPTQDVSEAPVLRPAERSEAEYLTFFDGSNDATGLIQDLDWLLGVSPWDASVDLPGLNFFDNTTELPIWSPESEVSHRSSAVALHVESTDHVPREKVLSALAGLPPDVLTSSFFEPSNLEHFMQNYWQNYNPHFSLLHKATFSVQQAPPLLLVALLSLGATLSPDESHYKVAEKIHETLRWLILTSPEFQAPAPLWVVQALLIVQAYEKMFSTRKLHEMSHIFHYSVITLMRRGSSYSQEREDDVETLSMEKGWHRWAERELSYRAAYFAFIMDAQHSSIFGHTAALSLTDIHLPLPCSNTLWEAPTAAVWNRERSRAQPSPLFLPALRALLSRQPVPHTYSPFARFVLLHGLLCLTRHMITRDQTASCISVSDQQAEVDQDPSVTPEQDNWRDRLDRAIDTWSFSLLSQTPSLCLEAARPLQRIAHVSVHVSLVDFHVLAGAPNLATGGRARCDSVQFKRAYRRVSEWAHQRHAKRALSHCLLLIQETMFTRARYAASEDNIIIRPWVLYNTTLVLWAYGAIRGGSEEPACRQDVARNSHVWSAEEYLVHMLNGFMGDGDIVQLQGAHRTGGLISAVKVALEGCRWELLEEAKETLSRLPEQTTVLLTMADKVTV